MSTMYLTKKMTPDSLDDVRNMAQQTKDVIDHVYLHWTGGHYGQAYDAYHICIDKDGSIYIMCDSFADTLAHTYMRNSYSVGVTLCCCADASCEADGSVDLGSEPPTTEQIESMAQVVAVLSDEYMLPLDCPDYVMTHCEAAFEDGYGPGDGDPDMRWDLWYLPDEYGSGSLEPGGDLIRGKAAFYQRVWEHDVMGD